MYNLLCSIIRVEDDSNFDVEVNVSIEWTFPEFDESDRGSDDITGFDLWIAKTEIGPNQDASNLAIPVN